ncbi:serine/threonine protein kinase [Streptomyces sp. NBC_00365]|uniref:serine/threonine-protein kinase n=1 Tax=Streptomyces sp. NBC_00365 TaxID=2975726 RepID=UPI0022543D6A|nr:serine/threonine-protein kinase [Streptomyces sp. NBC_00365]MCX5094632.1 serine/threonine protein kinase [Streptomyces sp. NBC_00365]
MRFERVRLAGYEVQEVLGRGGFATVYRARQLAVGREVALKVDSRVLDSPRDRQRFMREVTAAGQLSGHPHVVPVYDAGVLGDNRPYMVLELCPGGSLGDRLHLQGPLSVKEARDIGVGIADAVAAAHTAGVLHRDIKPGNIMVNRYGGVALADFGLAAMPRPDRELSVTREALTPAYAPPEAFHLAEPTPAGDVYSLAATVYALLRGRPPHFPEDGTQLSLAELIVRHTWPYPDLPGVPTALNEALGQALVADPARRLSDAGALRDALAAVDVDSADRIGFGPVPGRTTTVPAHRDTPPPPEPGPPGTTTVPRPPDPKKKGRRPQLIAVVAAVAVSVSVSVTLITYQGRGSDTPKSPSTASRPSVTPSAVTAGFGGVSTTTRDCPAVAVDGADGRCVTTPECWSGITDVSGTITVSLADCRVKHVWETFAIAPLPKDGTTNNARDLIKHPTVQALCSRKVMLKSRTATGRAVTSRWSTDILPPTAQQWADGLRVFRCVAHAATEDGEITDSHFG